MNPNLQLACNYAVLRFLPYPETGEFVNLGVAVHCPGAGHFGSKFETTRTKRVTTFFPELPVTRFRAARLAMANELERVGAAIRMEPNAQLQRRYFQELVRPREAIFRFGEIRTILTPDPALVAGQLFEQYVQRQFAQPREYHEIVTVRRYLQALQVGLPNQTFRRDIQIGTDRYHVTAPIASVTCGANGEPQLAIKPLDLQREEPTQVLDHGDAWIQKLRRLRDSGRSPQRFIVTVRQPVLEECRPAADEIVAGLREAGADVIDSEDTPKLLELAAE